MVLKDLRRGEGPPEGGGLPLEGEEDDEHVEALGQAEALALLSEVAARFEGRPRPPEAGLEAHLDREDRDARELDRLGEADRREWHAREHDLALASAGAPAVAPARLLDKGDAEVD